LEGEYANAVVVVSSHYFEGLQLVSNEAQGGDDEVNESLRVSKGGTRDEVEWLHAWQSPSDNLATLSSREEVIG
jgi:hypothetical protein